VLASIDRSRLTMISVPHHSRRRVVIIGRSSARASRTVIVPPELTRS
jgi:hypothetical protein